MALCGIGIAAAAGWLVAGGSVPPVQPFLGQVDSAAADGLVGGAPVHLDSAPSGAMVRVDGRSRGQTPLATWLTPGQHTLSLDQPDSLAEQQSIDVADSGASVHMDLWQRRPQVVPVRPVYPGASLRDVAFLNDGQLMLSVGMPTQAAASIASTELWRMDPATGQLSRLKVPGLQIAPSVMAVAPDDDQLAYVVPGSSATTTASGWSTTSNNPSTGAAPQASRPESIWLAPLDGSQPPRHVFDLPLVAAPSLETGSPEHVVELLWTPDEKRLVVITRQPGPPLRARIFLVDVADAQDAPSDALVLLPAEVLPGSEVIDPSGRWLALVTHAAMAPGGTDILNACTLELAPGGGFRDLADLGTLDRAPSVAPFAWVPASSTDPLRLVFVGPAPSVSSNNGGLFGIFGALRPAPPPMALFAVAVEASGLQEAQPRRLGSITGVVGPVWRSDNSLLGFARQDDGTLGLRSIDPTSGAVHDTGVRLPAGTGQGSGLAARWDTVHGYAALTTRATASTIGTTSGMSGALQAWLVSFAPNSNKGQGS